uniref:Peroxidase n=1 Tax=Anopheles albimanus TaxID=7167 RepID=A0A182FL01_ANOAL
MADERTPLTTVPPSTPPFSAGPSSAGTVHHLKPHESLRERQVRTFQCWICSAILGAFVLAIVICISYIIFGDATISPLDGSNTTAADFPELLNLISFPLADEPVPEWNGTDIGEDEKMAAVAEGEKALGDKELLEETLAPPPVNSPSFRHQKSVGATMAARLAAKVGFVEDRATKALLHKMLFNPYSLYAATGLDDALGGAISTALAKYDQYFSTELTERLFEKADEHLLHNHPCGLDLVSLNIQRGRDHGLPAYPHWRRHCHLTPADTWDQLERIVDPASFQQMKTIYHNPVNVDVYSGALSEPPVNGGIVGPLLTCLLADQFLRLKQGDSFWYERRQGVQRFTEEQLQQIYETKLSSIICRNSDHIEQSPVYLMKKSDPITNPETNCKELDTFDFNAFHEDAHHWQNKKSKLATDQMKVLVMEPKQQPAVH